MKLPSMLTNAFRRNPYPVYSALRRAAPVLRIRTGLWAVFDHDSVKRALQDHDAFSSRVAAPGGAPLDWLIFQDPPRHTVLRALITRTFAPRAVAELETRIGAIANDLIDEVIEHGAMDLVADFAERLPLLVIADMLGVPRADTPRLTAWGQAIIQLGDTLHGGERSACAVAAYRVATGEMHSYLSDLLIARRMQPSDDLLTRLVDAEVEGARLSDDEIVSFFQLLLLAGTETTTNLIANTVLCFLRHPGQCARVRAERALLQAALEEVLRFRSPVQMVFRTTTRDISMRGREIPRGAIVLAMVGSANRDSRQYPHANRFDIARAGAPHVGFGHGAHYCVGAALARLEARIAITALLDRTSGWQLALRGPWTPRVGINVHGPQRLPIRFSRDACPPASDA